MEDAIALATAFIDRAPPLVPVFGHRCLVADPTVKTRAVLSVWHAVDSIFYGNDLADYLSREFGIPNPEWSSEETPRVPVWEGAQSQDLAGGDSRVCLCCNEPVEAEACQIAARVPWTEGIAHYWCHPGCLQASVHPAIPLYVLSLRDNESAPIYGTKPVKN